MAELEVIARICSGFSEKFGIPRQSGVVAELSASIVFEPKYRDPLAIRGLEEFSHIWLVWGFSQTEKRGFSATVRPPRLGGNKRVGVFATRSPYRPNKIAMSAVEIECIEQGTKQGSIIHVRGADLLNGTPIYDIKPYIPYTDSRPNAKMGFSEKEPRLSVHDLSAHQSKLKGFSNKDIIAVEKLLAHDPRPAYQNDRERVYGMKYCGYDIRFVVEEEGLFVVDIVDLDVII